MKTFILSTILICLLLSPLQAQYSKVEEVTIESKELGQTRELMIYTPFGYADSAYKYYNVMYVFDAQNRMFFDYTTSVSMLSKEAGQGCIVVGIKATFIEEIFYARNHDFLPSDTKRNMGPKSKGNAENFLKYIKNEVVPYIESNYPTLPGRTAVGHSLGASFITYALIEEPDLFDNYIAVSPNVDYDDQRLVRGLRKLNPEEFESKKYFYISHGDEGETWGWKEANENAYALLKDTLDSEKFQVTIEKHPEENHGSNFMPSLHSAMQAYYKTIQPQFRNRLSGKKYEVTIRLKVQDQNDNIYISGNQKALGNWKSDQIQMNYVSPLIREITLPISDHAEVMFYLDGESQAWIKYGDGGRTTYPMMIRPEEGAEYTFEVDGYNN
ncbi:alpha/beta hydrolase-fold protein [Mangrovivirga cuniculi]|uniref:Esterase n=1 Tax=Mangrovivirga cuniculi TaxID=2715131 RepID=A0A4D7JN91_9BACT|nr:alpha/beta hydrolase-fold protein [Mangrovivirga cuniculi]QCK16127.1 hypothetical protein DCC35_15960 [Mangrovivirga cuniculi]